MQDMEDNKVVPLRSGIQQNPKVTPQLTLQKADSLQLRGLAMMLGIFSRTLRLHGHNEVAAQLFECSQMVDGLAAKITVSVSGIPGTD